MMLLAANEKGAEGSNPSAPLELYRKELSKPKTHVSTGFMAGTTGLEPATSAVTERQGQWNQRVSRTKQVHKEPSGTVGTPECSLVVPSSGNFRRLPIRDRGRFPERRYVTSTAVETAFGWLAPPVPSGAVILKSALWTF
jgi:hypothetical protein